MRQRIFVIHEMRLRLKGVKRRFGWVLAPINHIAYQLALLSCRRPQRPVLLLFGVDDLLKMYTSH